MSSPGKSKRVWLAALAAAVVLVVVGVVAWLAAPRSRDAASAPNSGSTEGSSAGIAGETVMQVLLNGTDLAKILEQPFTRTPGSPMYGGFDVMDDSSTRGDCAGVVDVAPKSAYRSADVQSYARETWGADEPAHSGFQPLTTKVMFVKEAVVALPSAADAQALFANFTEQWKRCEGQAVNPAPTETSSHKSHLSGTEMHITDVRVSDTVLSASIVLDKNPKAPDTRAIGVQGNCIVGVLIAFTGVEHATGSGDPATSSSNAVRAMMDKVAKLS